jgi:hypothetical protein
MTSRPHTSSKDKAGAVWQFSVGLTLCAGAICLVYFVSQSASHAENVYLRELFVVLQQYGGKWVGAGLVALLGLAFCRAALRRLWTTAPDAPKFVAGTMRLESIDWIKQVQRDKTASTGSRAE